MRAVQDLSTLDAADVVHSIDRDGYCRIEGFADPAALAVAQDRIVSLVERNGGQYLFLRGAERLEGTFLATLCRDEAFMALARAVCEAAAGRVGAPFSAHQSLRVLAGESGVRESLRFHYDSYILTAILPVLLPEGDRGGLGIAPNTRPIRRSYLANVLDKVAVDNAPVQAALRRRHRRGALPYIPFRVGDLYLIWGYRSLHGNDACLPEDVRCTAIVHFADPHADSPMKRWIGRRRGVSAG